MVARLRILIATALVAVLAAPTAPASARPRPGATSPHPGHPTRALDSGSSSTSVVSRQGEEPRKGEKGGEASGPKEVFDDIERGWNARNVDLILRHFGSQKVAISLEGSGPARGEFSKSQSYYLLKDHFRYTNTRKFEFVQFRRSDEGAQSFAVAERHYLRRDDGRLIKDKVYVSLHLDRGADRERWVVDEIKSIR